MPTRTLFSGQVIYTPICNQRDTGEKFTPVFANVITHRKWQKSVGSSPLCKYLFIFTGKNRKRLKGLGSGILAKVSPKIGGLFTPLFGGKK